MQASPATAESARLSLFAAQGVALSITSQQRRLAVMSPHGDSITLMWYHGIVASLERAELERLMGSYDGTKVKPKASPVEMPPGKSWWSTVRTAVTGVASQFKREGPEEGTEVGDVETAGATGMSAEAHSAAVSEVPQCRPTPTLTPHSCISGRC